MADKYLNASGVAYLWSKITAALANKVDKETGKGLSSNDYTSDEKTKLANIASGAQVNVLEGIQVAGTTVTPTNKIANVPAMTGATASAAGAAGVVPKPAAGNQNKYLRGDGTWQTPDNTTYDPATATPSMDGTAAVGTSVKYAREDHVHPTDTSRAASSHAHGNITSGGDITTNTTIASGDRLVINDESASKVTNSSITFGTGTTTFLANNGTWQTPAGTTSPATAAPIMDGTAAVGTSAKYAREDHVHPSDSSKADASDLADYVLRAGDTLTGNLFAELGSEVGLEYGTDPGDLTAFIGNNGQNILIYNNDGVVDITNVKTPTNNTDAANKSYVDSAVAGVAVTIDSAMSSSSTNPVQNKVINTALGAKAPLASPGLTGTPTAPTAAAGTSTTQIATTAFVTNAVQTAQTGAAMFQGTITAASAITGLTNYKKGWYWVVGAAGTYVGQECESGDMIFCVSDYNSAYSAADFSVVQTNLAIAAMTNAEIDAACA